MADFKEEEIKKAGCFATGCGLTALSILVLPGTIALPVVNAAMETAISVDSQRLIPNPEEARNKLGQPETKVDMLVAGERMDKFRAVLATALFALLDVPQVVPQLLPPLAEFAKSIPNWVPEIAAGAAIIYGLSYLNMRGQRTQLLKETKVN